MPSRRTVTRWAAEAPASYRKLTARIKRLRERRRLKTGDPGMTADEIPGWHVRRARFYENARGPARRALRVSAQRDLTGCRP